MNNASASDIQQFGSVWTQCVARAWQDALFRAALKEDPAATLFEAYQFTVPAGVELQVVESDDAPREMKAQTLRMVIPPVPEMDMHEVALVGAEAHAGSEETRTLPMACFC
jgi:hypothetical protein